MTPSAKRAANSPRVICFCSHDCRIVLDEEHVVVGDFTARQVRKRVHRDAGHQVQLRLDDREIDFPHLRAADIPHQELVVGLDVGDLCSGLRDLEEVIQQRARLDIAVRVVRLAQVGEHEPAVAAHQARQP